MIPLEIYLIIRNLKIHAVLCIAFLISTEWNWYILVRKFNMNENGNFYFHAGKVENFLSFLCRVLFDPLDLCKKNRWLCVVDCLRLSGTGIVSLLPIIGL